MKRVLISLCVFFVSFFSTAQTVTVTDEPYTGNVYNNGAWVREITVTVTSSTSYLTSNWVIALKLQREVTNILPLDNINADEFDSPSIFFNKGDSELSSNWLVITPTDSSLEYDLSSGSFTFKFCTNTTLINPNNDSPNGENRYLNDYKSQFPLKLNTGTASDIWLNKTNSTKVYLGQNYSSVGIGYDNPTHKLSVAGDGFFLDKVGIGIRTDKLPDDYNLGVNGGIIAKKVKVAIPGTTEWPDYVFSTDYERKTLEEVEAYVDEHKHLPGVPSAEKVAEDGYDISEMDAKLLEKIEELTLYMIELKKQNEELKAELDLLK